jgi:hypothetical protein
MGEQSRLSTWPDVNVLTYRNPPSAISYCNIQYTGYFKPRVLYRMLRLCLGGRLRFECDGTHAETRFRLSAKRTSPFKPAGSSVVSNTGSRGVRISGSYAGYTMFRASVKSTGYPLHSSVFLSLPIPCVTVCHHISTGLYTRLQVGRGQTILISIVIFLVQFQLPGVGLKIDND